MNVTLHPEGVNGAVQTEGTLTYATFIQRHVPELLVHDNVFPIGDVWLDRKIAIEPLTPVETQPPTSFIHEFVTFMARRLMLELLRRRLIERGGPLKPLRTMEAEFQPVIDVVQTHLSRAALADFLPPFRHRYALSGEAALLDALKRYVRFCRTAERGYVFAEKYVLALHLQVAAERNGLVPAQANQCADGYDVLSAVLERDAQAPAVRVARWPVQAREPSFRYREIRDPRCRRFRT
ncbi:hypothetical protein LAJ19_16670 (plasmid) [Deinococcus taeanensis]|uniref:hypothetical protein n=1 Tax=Deinococcus taeanensis TaxID=2737050 RepID=UPI001CDD8A61|nr:hypothetical protein [Deinococcus taeanensis]UBV44779.1 hypothetical protein LAJ19_16670 [Deinococcus taeanensis]